MQRIQVLVALVAGIVGPVHSATAQDAALVLTGEEVFAARVVELTKAGTLRLSRGSEALELRLASIRFPGVESDLGRRADRLLRQRLLNETVEVHVRGVGSRGEPLTGWVLLGRADPRVELVEEGYARYCPHSRLEPELEQLQSAAIVAGRGMWDPGHSDSVPDCETAR